MAAPIVPVQAKFLDAVGAVSAIWMKYFQGLSTAPRVALADAATITLDASKGSVFDVTLSGSRTIAAPLNPTDGQTMRIRLRQDAVGSRTVTWNAAFHFGTVGAPVLSVTAGKTDLIACTYNAQNGAWECVLSGQGY